MKSARQVIDALNAEGQHIDIILAEVDLPMRKGMKMLKYITGDKELRRIPVISKLRYPYSANKPVKLLNLSKLCSAPHQCFEYLVLISDVRTR